MVTLDRKRMLHVFKLAKDAGPYDELPILVQDIDPQLHLSRNDRPQPFFLICEQDTVLVQMSGEGKIQFKDAPVLWHPTEPGDFVYVPAGTPHRILPITECVQLRFKARRPGLEAVAWYCEQCGAEVYREDFDTQSELSQEGYWRICQMWNADVRKRVCPKCGAEHPPSDLTGIRWPEVAAAIRAA
jgi:3-hydroxyanthranilate 3,4-dioxygenase